MTFIPIIALLLLSPLCPIDPDDKPLDRTDDVRTGDTLLYIETATNTSVARYVDDTTARAVFVFHDSMQTELIRDSSEDEGVIRWQGRRRSTVALRPIGGQDVPNDYKRRTVNMNKEYPWESFTTDMDGAPRDSSARRFFQSVRTELCNGSNLAPGLWVLTDTVLGLGAGETYTLFGTDTIALKSFRREDSTGADSRPLVRSYRVTLRPERQFDSMGHSYLSVAWRVDDFSEVMEFRNVRMSWGGAYPTMRFRTCGESQGNVLYDLESRMLVALDGSGKMFSTVEKTRLSSAATSSSNVAGVFNASIPTSHNSEFTVRCRRVR